MTEARIIFKHNSNALHASNTKHDTTKDAITTTKFILYCLKARKRKHPTPQYMYILKT